jgi:hypothetical protein
MANERLNIPGTLKVGFQEDSDAYSGMLAYVTYINDKDEIAKHVSWEGWRDKNIDVKTYENKPIEGFVLNKRAGGYKSGWNFRQTKCRVYDPRGFEVEISVDNLLYILQECSSRKGKGLEGKFVYAWSGAELILLPVCSEDYKASTDLIRKREKITLKTIKVGAAYKASIDSIEDQLIYIGKMKWHVWYRNENSITRYDTEYWNEVRKILLPTFVDLKGRCFRGIKNLNKLDYLIKEDAITPADVESYIDNFKMTPAFTTQFVDKLTIGSSLKKWNNFEHRTNDAWGTTILYMQRPGEDFLTKIYAYRKKTYQGKDEYAWIKANAKWSMSSFEGNEKEELMETFKKNAKLEMFCEKSSIISYNDGKLKEDICLSNWKHYVHITEDDMKYISDDMGFTSTRDKNEKIERLCTNSLSETKVKFSKNCPL